jgi:hypothetical protein
VQQVLYRKPYATEWETLSFEQAMEMAAQRVKKARDENWQVAMPSRSPAEPGPDTFRLPARELQGSSVVLCFSIPLPSEIPILPSVFHYSVATTAILKKNSRQRQNGRTLDYILQFSGVTRPVALL